MPIQTPVRVTSRPRAVRPSADPRWKLLLSGKHSVAPWSITFVPNTLDSPQHPTMGVSDWSSTSPPV